MTKCGFCHAASGHNRRTCEKIFALREAGHSVKSTHTVEDFPDFFNADSDFEPSPSNGSSSESDKESAPAPKESLPQSRPAPSNNALNVPARAAPRSPSPIISRSLDDLADDAGLFDASIGSPPSFSTPLTNSVPSPRPFRVRPPPQFRLRAPAGFVPRALPPTNNLPYVPPHLRPQLSATSWSANPRLPYRPLMFSTVGHPRMSSRPPSSIQPSALRPRSAIPIRRSVRAVRRNPTVATPASGTSTVPDPSLATSTSTVPVVPATSETVGV